MQFRQESVALLHRACVSVQFHWGVRDNGTLMARAASYRRIPIAVCNFDAQFPPQREAPYSDDANLFQDLILSRVPKPNKSRIFYMPYNHTTWPLSIFCIMKLRRFGPGSNSQPWVQEASDKPTTPPSRLLLKILN
ncbi:hypothetical protein TNCV_2069121 [Trichonephila clavipes]|uniref:Uncharacterized protein n=1 Tax=Trichonephila clavipes TaxID=2585209 RepID=A0A8X6W2V7_TRICX|nr:hypothetical protein TNCV_2069121 [Trichonephila clavipes]